jgi:hypothetical protein
MSLFELSKFHGKNIAFNIKRMMWHEEEEITKYHLVNWG